MSEPVTSWPLYLFGIVGGLLFYGRFFVQWIASERRKQSVMPIAFWYMSSFGSLILLIFGVLIRSPLGALGHSLNIVIYSRNLVHIWRAKGAMTPARNLTIHCMIMIIALVALGFTGYTWLQEYEATQSMTTKRAQQTWAWLAAGLLGQALFAARFLIQWLVTERRRESFVPDVFWYLSLIASILMGATFVQRREWIYAVGMIATIFVYARNIWFIRSSPKHARTANSESYSSGE